MKIKKIIKGLRHKTRHKSEENKRWNLFYITGILTSLIFVNGWKVALVLLIVWILDRFFTNLQETKNIEIVEKYVNGGKNDER